jgi:hypothetical protein
MDTVYSILIDLGVLCFFGFLFYLFQKRRIIRNSTYEIQVGLQKFIYDLHSYLDQKESEDYYQELNNFAQVCEEVLESPNILEEKERLNAPHSLPSELKESLNKILELF